MKRTITDERLMQLARRAYDREGDYWLKVYEFLRGLLGRTEVTLKEHNWLSQIREDLKEPWE